MLNREFDQWLNIESGALRNYNRLLITVNQWNIIIQVDSLRTMDFFPSIAFPIFFFIFSLQIHIR